VLPCDNAPFLVVDQFLTQPTASPTAQGSLKSSDLFSTRSLQSVLAEACPPHSRPPPFGCRFLKAWPLQVI